MSALTISHDAVDGTLVHGTHKGDGSRAILRTYGLRWGHAVAAWYVPHSRAREADTQTIDALTSALRADGFAVDVHITAVSVADAEQARAMLAQSREASLHSRAQVLEQQTAGQHDQVRAIPDVITAGQPILVSHHSEGGHRRDLQRADRAMGRAVNTGQAAEAAARAADAAARAQVQRESLPSIGRRLERLRADAASLERRIGGTATTTPAAGDYLARLTGEAARVAEQLGYWTSKRDEILAATDAREWSRDDFVVGDRIRTAKGLTATVRRVNTKSLTAHFDVMPPSITNKLPYYDVADRLTRVDAEAA